MKSIRVNADYESQLFYGKSPSTLIDQTIEFLAVFLDERPLFTQKKYQLEYLEYVESLTGRRVQFRNSGDYENWWGELKNLELEKNLNSKLTSTQFLVENGLCDKSLVVRSSEDFESIPYGQKLILKNPYGMSGRNFQILPEHLSSTERESILLSAVGKGPLVVEPFLQRVFDFSHYVLPTGKVIAYENFVDERFQYKGTLIRDYSAASIFNLRFYDRISTEEWGRFQSNFNKIKEYYFEFNPRFGFSVDSFIHRVNEEMLIRDMCEVNFRRTMGSVTHELAVTYSKHRPWAMLVLAKSFKDQGGFSFLKEKLKDHLLQDKSEAGVIILSPGDSRFDCFFLSAINDDLGEELLKCLNNLLPNGHFPVKI